MRDKSKKTSKSQLKRIRESLDDEISSDEEIQQEKKSYKDISIEEDDFFETYDERKISMAKKYLRKLDIIDNEGSYDLSSLEDKIQKKELANNLKLSTKIFYKGHKLSVTCISVSDDSKIAYTGGKDCAMIRWDLETGNKTIYSGRRKLFDCGGHFEQIKSICIQRDKNLICTAGVDRVIRLWDSRSPNCIDKLHGHTDTITGLVSEPNSDMNQIISVSYDKTLKLWSLDSRAHMNTYYGHTNHITTCDIAIRDRPLTGSEDYTSRLWKLSADSHLIFHSDNSNNNKINTPIDSVCCIDNSTFLTGTQDGSIQYWSQFKKKPLLTCNKIHNSIISIRNIKFSDLVFTGGYDGAIKAWKIQNNQIINLSANIEIDGFVNSMDVTDKVLVAAIGQEHRLGRWETVKCAKNGILVQSLEFCSVD
ncbi:hypothetical protein cand_038480 [Cryptosporidium andersoni]|uniref:Uncharacterized protein n=1 Tax=Cryptosporidium andersoni TaxID=117008 RepID=A0A1J4MXS8_9CRYT|nr:hypothetical protein cand_038480 [Cryptosporidium andersoni]